MACFSVVTTTYLTLFLLTVGTIAAAADENLLRKISTVFPDFLSLDFETVEDFLLTYGSGGLGNHFLPLPEGGHQKGRCNEVFTSRGEGEDIKWLQGHTNLTHGAATIIVHLSQPDSHLDILKKLNKIYRNYREVGLNVIGIFSRSSGYALSEEEEEDISLLLKRARIAFPCAALGSKRGVPPTLKSGFIDTAKAQAAPTSPQSLFRRLHGDLEFVAPLSIVLKNCMQMQQEPSAGYAIMGLEGSLSKSASALLWPEGSKMDSAEQDAEFRETLRKFEINGDELGAPIHEVMTGIEEERESSTSKKRRKKRRNKAVSVEQDDEDQEEEDYEDEITTSRRHRRRRRKSEL